MEKKKNDEENEVSPTHGTAMAKPKASLASVKTKTVG